MNSWVLIYLAGPVGSDLLIVGAYATEAAALAAMVTTGAPYNYQICQVWGPPANPPPSGTPQTPYAPVNVDPASAPWLAVAPGTSPSGGLLMFGYGTFTSKADALAWARLQDNPSGFSFGVVQATP